MVWSEIYTYTFPLCRTRDRSGRWKSIWVDLSGVDQNRQSPACLLTNRKRAPNKSSKSGQKRDRSKTGRWELVNFSLKARAWGCLPYPHWVVIVSIHTVTIFLNRSQNTALSWSSAGPYALRFAYVYLSTATTHRLEYPRRLFHHYTKRLLHRPEQMTQWFEIDR